MSASTSRDKPLRHRDVTTKEEENELMRLRNLDRTKNMLKDLIHILMNQTLVQMIMTRIITSCSPLHQGTLDYHQHLVDRGGGYPGGQDNFKVSGEAMMMMMTMKCLKEKVIVWGVKKLPPDWEICNLVI